eukprot:1909239-Pleurochrysis_carterae.AAC.1
MVTVVVLPVKVGTEGGSGGGAYTYVRACMLACVLAEATPSHQSCMHASAYSKTSAQALTRRRALATHSQTWPSCACR